MLLNLKANSTASRLGDLYSSLAAATCLLALAWPKPTHASAEGLNKRSADGPVLAMGCPPPILCLEGVPPPYLEAVPCPLCKSPHAAPCNARGVVHTRCNRQEFIRSLHKLSFPCFPSKPSSAPRCAARLNSQPEICMQCVALLQKGSGWLWLSIPCPPAPCPAIRAGRCTEWLQ